MRFQDKEVHLESARIIRSECVVIPYVEEKDVKVRLVGL